MKNNNKNAERCPCKSGKLFNDCCQPYIEQRIDAPTAEALMRSRYTAFVLCDETYLRYSWHPNNCPEIIHLNKNTTWLGLKIRNSLAGNIDDPTGKVEFVARNKIHGKASRIHENSQFTRYCNRWVYIDGETLDETKTILK